MNTMLRTYYTIEMNKWTSCHGRSSGTRSIAVLGMLNRRAFRALGYGYENLRET
jgi:hypothetical protein